MLQRSDPLSSKDFSKGLITRDDMLSTNFDQSPNCSDIKWYFDGSIGKRFGSSTTNTVALTNTGASSTFIVQNSLTNNLLSYWKIDEASGTRIDSVSTNNLLSLNGITSITGIRGNAASYTTTSQVLYATTVGYPSIGVADFTVSYWFYLNAVSSQVLSRFDDANGSELWSMAYSVGGSTGLVRFEVLTNTGGYREVFSSSNGTLSANTWYNLIAWHSNGTHIGISINQSINTNALLSGPTPGILPNPWAKF